MELHRFGSQVNQAVRNTIAKYGRWVDVSDLTQQAYALMLGYGRKGDLSRWEAKVAGDAGQLQRYVLRALNCDLSDYARRIVRAGRREMPAGEVTVTPGYAEDETAWLAWPLLEFRYRYRLTEKDIAKRLGMSLRTAQRRIHDELASARATYQGV